jgi:stage II sporulation protein D
MARRRGIARRLRRQARRLARAGVLLGIGAMALALVVALLLEPGAGARRTHARGVRLPGNDPAIEILLTALEGSTHVHFASEGGWRITNESGDEVARTTSPLPASFGTTTAGKLALRGAEVDARALTIEGLDGAPIKVGKSTYRGKISVRAGARGLRVVNIVGIEAYLASVVGSEMYASSTPAAALEAQAIAARTYARYEIEKRGRIPLPDNQEAQAYYGIERETAATRAAAAATRHRVLAFDDDLLPAFYHSTCGGRTVDGSDLLGSPAPPPLRGVSCGYCSAAKYFRWNVGIGAIALPALAAELKVGNRIVRIEPLGPADDPWASVQVTGTGGAVKLAARAFRSAVHRARVNAMIPSPFLQEIIGDGKGGITVSGRGFGHGVGMCQMGAAEMARRGQSTEQILRHYYPGVQLVSTSRVAEAAVR